MTCNVCGHDRFHQTAVTDTFRVDGRLFLVEGIPAEVCERCGEPNFSLAVAEQLRRLIHSPHQILRTIPAEVIAYGSAAA